MSAQEELKISTVEALKVLADPLRMRIVEHLNRPQTVKQLKRTFGVSTNKLYYHVHLLEEHGFVQVVDERPAGALTEKIYQTTARRIHIDRKLLAPGSSEGDDGQNEFAGLVLENTRRDLIESLQQGTIDLARQPPEPGAMLLSRSIGMFSDAQARRFYQRLEEAIDEVDAMEADERDGEAKQPYVLTIAFFPEARAEGDSSDEDGMTKD